MSWLFERTIEIAAWAAFFIAWSSLIVGLYWTYLWIGTVSSEPDYELLRDATKAGGAFVCFSIALGVLACIDRFLFDADQE